MRKTITLINEPAPGEVNKLERALRNYLLATGEITDIHNCNLIKSDALVSILIAGESESEEEITIDIAKAYIFGCISFDGIKML